MISTARSHFAKPTLQNQFQHQAQQPPQTFENDIITALPFSHFSIHRHDAGMSSNS
jgi:hypothetical protein